MKSAQKIATAFALISALALLLACSGLCNEDAPSSLTGNEPSAGGWVFSRSSHGTAPAVLTVGTLASPMSPELGIAVADFTGDTHPDLATVEVDRFESAKARYCIEIQLTEGGRQFLRVTAPFGGLLITPRDVTGDGNLDLIVRSAESRTLVAVFLNDGNGHFSRADTAKFAASLHEVPSEFRLTTQQVYLSATLACLESHTAECPTGSLRYLRERKGLLLSSNYRAASRPFLSFGANRAPPPLA